MIHAAISITKEKGRRNWSTCTTVNRTGWPTCDTNAGYKSLGWALVRTVDMAHDIGSTSFSVIVKGNPWTLEQVWEKIRAELTGGTLDWQLPAVKHFLKLYLRQGT